MAVARKNCERDSEVKILKYCYYHNKTQCITYYLFSGLMFLHSHKQKPSIHCDIKPDNILLDSNDSPMIADFAFCRTGLENDESLSVLKVYGTKNYIPKECVRQSAISTKVDDHCFGIILFELATGEKNLLK